jgi:hypothetical protein
MPEPITSPEPLDDVDRLFARLQPAPVPSELTARVLASTVARPTPSRASPTWPWMLVGLVSLALLVLTGYGLGASLAASDGLDIVEALAGDLTLVASAPGDVLAALGEVVPVGLLLLAALSAAVLIWAAGHLIARAPRPVRTRSVA